MKDKKNTVPAQFITETAMRQRRGEYEASEEGNRQARDIWLRVSRIRCGGGYRVRKKSLPK